MLVKFKIIFEDDTFLESHDKMWNQVKDHCHALPPFTNKKWLEYQIITDEGFFIAVNFKTGLFDINGQLIHPADKDKTVLTHKTDPQTFPVARSREILNGMFYFPIFGRSVLKGDWGETKLLFCGWKRKRGKRTIEKVATLFPNGQVSLT